MNASSQFVFAGVHYFQFGKHLQHSTLSDMKDVWILLYASQIVYPLSIVLTKSSIVFLLYRTFRSPQAKLYASMMIITIIAWGLSAVSLDSPIVAKFQSANEDQNSYLSQSSLAVLSTHIGTWILRLDIVWTCSNTFSARKSQILFSGLWLWFPLYLTYGAIRRSHWWKLRFYRFTCLAPCK